MIASDGYGKYFTMIDDIVKEMFFNQKKHQNYDILDEDGKQLVRNLFELKKRELKSNTNFDDILYK